ncbi:PAS domain S-box protein [Acidobacteriota bacterium]
MKMQNGHPSQFSHALGDTEIIYWENEEQFRKIHDHISDGVVIVIDGKNHWVNKAMERVTGYTREELVGQGPGFLVGVEELPELEKRMKARMAGDEVASRYETKIIRKDGTSALITVRARRMVFNKRLVTSLIVRDISEVSRAREDLESTERRFTTLVENAPVGVYSTDVDGNFLYANNALVRILDCESHKEVMASNVKDFYKNLEDRERLIQLVRTEGRVKAFELDIISRTGADKHVLLSAGLDDRILSGMLVDLTRRMRVEADLKKSREELRNLSIHQEQIREAERTRIARELHDQLGQVLTGLKFHLSWVYESLESQPQEASKKLESMLELIDGTIHTVRRICSELRPGVLDEIGLTAAIEWQAEQFEDQTGIRCETVIEPAHDELDRDLSTALFRILQEALTNIARHANASAASVSLTETDDQIVLSIKDDGKGIREESIISQESYGLIGMRERAHSWGGAVRIMGLPGQGTTVTVSLPFHKDK